MTPEERKMFLESNKYRATLVPDSVAKRRFSDAARMRLKRSLETSEMVAERRKKQALRAREKRARETPEQVELRRAAQRNRARLRRSLESEEQREVRKERERLRARERRAAMSAEKKELRREMDRNRKRFIRQQEKNPNHNNQVAHPGEYHPPNLPATENSYPPSSNLVFTRYDQTHLNDDLLCYPLHMLVDPQIDERYMIESHRKTGITSKEQVRKNKATITKENNQNRNWSRPPMSNQISVQTNTEKTEDEITFYENKHSETFNIIRKPYVAENNVGTNNGGDVRPEKKELIDISLSGGGRVIGGCQMNTFRENVNDFIQFSGHHQREAFLNLNHDIQNKTKKEPAEYNMSINKDLHELRPDVNKMTNIIQMNKIGLVCAGGGAGGVESPLSNNANANQEFKMEKINKLLGRMYGKDLQ